MKKISVIIPCYCSQTTIVKVVDLTRKELLRLQYDYEFVLVNDGSYDNTFQEIRNLCLEDSKVKGLDCSRNFGQHNAILAGLHHVTGDYVLGMDDDLQTHPSQIQKLIEKMNEGWDVVFARYVSQKQSFFRNIGTGFTRWTICNLTNRPTSINASSFWIAKKYVCQEAIRHAGPYTYIQGLFFRTTKDIVDVPVEHFERTIGCSGYNLRSLIRQWSTIINFSITPLRFSIGMGFFIGLIGIILAITLVINKIFNPAMQLGWSSLMVTLLISFGLNLLCIGIVGEYLGRLFMINSNAPQFILKEKLNCERQNNEK